ncbi:MFS transporter [Fontivita pretiosa]|uniref:MFS transporter n=1 Tax=Fontivita pretiosa TaxID=2989684 RepID=UPI003D16704C
MDTPASPAPPADRKLFRVGTLTYTKAQLLNVFFWLLWGDFCLHLMDNGVIPTLVPLQLEALGASKATIGLVYGTIVNVMYFVLVPIVSTASDRYRSRWGRRIPFLLVPTPFLALCLILLGFSQHIAMLLQRWLPALLGAYPVLSIALVVACVLFLLLKFFDMFPQSVYYYMWADVIPPQLMGVFGSLFRVCYAAGSLVFNYFLIGLAKEHPEQIYIASALLYLIAFVGLCLMVREGQYPPPDPPDPELAARGRVAAFFDVARTYIRECFSSAFWWKYFLMNAAFQCGYQPFIINLVFLGKEIYGDTPEGLARYGRVLALRDVVWIAIYLALVPIMVRLHPLKAALGGYVLMTLTAIVSFFLVHNPISFGVMTILTFITVAIYLGGTAALNPRMLPQQQFGQFASAGAMIFRITVAISAWAMGLVLDWTASNRFIYLWLFIFTAIGTVLTVMVYREWKALGGEEAYTPPVALAR